MQQMKTMEQIKKFRDNLWANATRVDKRAKNNKRRLSRFPLWKRILFFWKFTKIRRMINAQVNARAYYVMMVLSLQRKVKFIGKSREGHC